MRKKPYMRLVSCIAALVMVISMVPVNAYAMEDESVDVLPVTDYTEDENVATEYAVDKYAVAAYAADEYAVATYAENEYSDTKPQIWILHTVSGENAENEQWISMLNTSLHWDHDGVEPGWSGNGYWAKVEVAGSSLMVWSDDMIKDLGETDARSSQPYFYEYADDGETKVAKYELAYIQMHPGKHVAPMNDGSTNYPGTATWSYNDSPLNTAYQKYRYSNRNGKSRYGSGKVALLYVWTRTELTPPAPTDYTITYNLNPPTAETGYVSVSSSSGPVSKFEVTGSASANTPYVLDTGSTDYKAIVRSADATVTRYKLVGWTCGEQEYELGATIESVTGNMTFTARWEPITMRTIRYNVRGNLPAGATVTCDNGTAVDKTDTLEDGSIFKLNPGSKPDGTKYQYTASVGDKTYYNFLGWSCDNAECQTNHQIGEEFTANSDMTFTAVWEENLHPQYTDEAIAKGEDILKRDPTQEEIDAAGVPVNEFVTSFISNDFEIKQITGTGDDSSQELPADGVVQYVLSTGLGSEVYGNLDNSWKWSENFAQFNISLNLDSRLHLTGNPKARDNEAVILFKCYALQPVKDEKGNPLLYLNGTQVSVGSLEGDRDSGWIYSVSASSLEAAADAGSRTITIPVKWNPAESGQNILQGQTGIEIGLYAKVNEEDRNSAIANPVEVSASVTGWVDTNEFAPQDTKAWSGLLQSILRTTPGLEEFLKGHGFEGDEMYKEVQKYLADPAVRKALLDRDPQNSNTVELYLPHTVTFNSNGGSAVESKKVRHNTPVTRPTDPTRTGYDFAGWTRDGVPYDFATLVDENFTLVGTWTRAAHDHVWGEWTVVREANCGVDGWRVHSCTLPDCNYSEGEAIPATGNHTWGDWITDVAATYTTEGLEHHTCSVCAAEETRIIPMLTQPYIPPVTPVTPVTPTIPDTPTPLDPGTNIPDENVPLANTVGLNNVDHFAYIAGYEDGTVRPTNNITRAEVATIFFRLMTEDYRVANWSTSNTFTDASPSGWYNAAISTAAKAGILKGYADGSVKPNANITRAEFATIAARFISDEITDDGVGDFSDTANHWAAKEIRLAAKAGWIVGDGNRFRPDDPITRAEVMVLVNRMLDRVPDADHMLPGMKIWSDNPEGTWYYAAVQEATNDHDYERAEDGATEIWTALTEAKDWTALEAEWIANNGASAPKAETETQGLPDGI